MKSFSIKSLMFLFIVLGLSMASCGSEKVEDARDEARESLAKTNAPTAKQTANVTNPTADKKGQQATVPTGPTTTMEFSETKFDFGTVMDGEKVSHKYKFTNTGNEPLVISNAKGSCGCTVPSWPREPIPVGATSEILVEFDSKGKGKVGGQKQTKRVTITANTNPTNAFLTITGNVEKKDDGKGGITQQPQVKK